MQQMLMAGGSVVLDGGSSAAATTPHFLRNTLGITTDGWYWIQDSNMKSASQAAVYAYIYFNMLDSKDWVLTMDVNQTGNQSGALVSNGSFTGDHRTSGLYYKGFALYDDSTLKGYGYVGAASYNGNRNSTELVTGGNKAGKRLYLNAAGGHGFFATTVGGQCNWQNCSGSEGALYDGSCGVWPTSLRWGYCSGGPGMDSNSYWQGRIKSWIWMDSVLPE